MIIPSALIMLIVTVSSSEKLITFGENSQGFGRRSLSSKCLVDNPDNADRPLCYVNGEHIDTCSNMGCGGCCGSQCSWVGTYCNEEDGVVAKCPGGYSQVGTLSQNNDIGGVGLGQSHEKSIADCKDLCEKDSMCVAFMYGGKNTEADSTLCELASSVTPNNNWGSNFRFCRKTVKCLEENPNNADRPQCFLNEVHKDTCSNKGCNGCCGSTCSWIGSYCSERIVSECPSGYQQIGTLSENNDVGGRGLGQTEEDSIEECQAKCESTEGCVAFMYGGLSTVHDSKLCELSSVATPNRSWGTNFRFCQMLTAEPTLAPTTTAPTKEPTTAPTSSPTAQPTQAPHTSFPSISPIYGKCLVDNPDNADRPLCYVNGEHIDTCSNMGCGGCCGSQCSWVGTYCNERDGVVAKCPGGYTQVGTLSENNDIGGVGLGQSNEDSIEKCRDLCEKDSMCVAFMYGGSSTEADSTLCELASSVTPNNNWGTNFRFCRKTVQCLEENPNNADKPLCFLNEVHKDTCSNKGCNGCCGSTCSWISNYCSERIVAECPSGYKQIGTLSGNNDVRGGGLGTTDEDSIEECQAKCESTEGCVAFMYGGLSTVHDSKLCELSNVASPNNSWGTNFRFCQMLTAEPTLAPTTTAPTKEPTSAPTSAPTSGPSKTPTRAPTDLSTPEYALITDASSCEAAGMKTITTTLQCAAAVSALDLADVDASDITLGDYHDRKDGCIWHAGAKETTLFSGSQRPDELCNYRGYAGCICAKPEFAMVTDATSCEAVGMKTITKASQCAAALSTLNLADGLDANDITVSEYHDRKDGCIWHAGAQEATLFSGSARPDEPCNYRGYSGCICANPQTVTCEMTIDNKLTQLQYNGQDISTTSGDWSSWTSTKTFSFFAVEGAYLEIGGHEYSDCNGCKCSGLLVECDNGFVSSTSDWTAIGASSEIVNPTTYGSVCKSTSGFYMKDQTSDAQKIWPSGGEKHAYFRAIPVPKINFVQGPKEGCQSGYVQPANAEACQAVAEANNVRYWGGSGHSSSADPHGCIYRTPDQDIYFNTHSIGSTNRNDRRTVCVEDN